MKNKNNKRFGLFYKSHGEWTKTPYSGMTFTKYQVSREPIKGDIEFFRKNLLKSKVCVRRVES